MDLQYKLRKEYLDICAKNGGILISTLRPKDECYEIVKNASTAPQIGGVSSAAAAQPKRIRKPANSRPRYFFIKPPPIMPCFPASVRSFCASGWYGDSDHGG